VARTKIRRHTAHNSETKQRTHPFAPVYGNEFIWFSLALAGT
jgi:hypothetical protein